MRDAFDGWPVLGNMPGWAQAVACVPVAVLLVLAFWAVVIGGIGVIEGVWGATAAVAVLVAVLTAAFLSRMK